MTVTGTGDFSEDSEGYWFAVDSAKTEVVRALVHHLTPGKVQPDLSLWWTGSATPDVVGAWVTDTVRTSRFPIRQAPGGSGMDSTAECRLTLWSDEVSKDDIPYSADAFPQIADDLTKWATSGAIGCSILRMVPTPHQIAYMWAALRSPDAQMENGEVGLQYAARDIATEHGQHVFATLLENTVATSLSKDAIASICNSLAERVAGFMSDAHPNSAAPSSSAP
jgi:hypothetical protein